jgi:hypothetical protein
MHLRIARILGHGILQLGSARVPCPDGEVRLQIDVREVAINYDGPVSRAVARVGPLSYEVSLSPSQLQELTVDTQRENEFAKALIAAYNACAISKQDFRDGLFQMSPRFSQTTDAIGLVVAKLSQSKVLNREDQRLVTRVLLTLQKVAELDSKNTERILLAIDREQHVASVSTGVTQVGEFPQNSSIASSPAGLVALTNSLSASGVIVGSGGVIIGGQIGDLTQIASQPAGLGTLAGNFSTLPSTSIIGSGGVITGGIGGQIGDLTQIASQPAGLGTLAGNFSTLPSTSIIGSGGVITGSIGGQIGDLTQITSQNAGLGTFAGNLSTFSSITIGGSTGGLSSTVTSTWTSTNSLDQTLSTLNGALMRSTIGSNPGQYEFPSSASCQLGLCNVSITSDSRSVLVLRCTGSTLSVVTATGIEINSPITPSATSCEHEH